MRSKLAVLLTVFVLIAPSGFCGKIKNSPLEGTTWKLNTLDRATNSLFSESDNFTIKFDSNGSFFGIGACNRFFGEFTTAKRSIIDIRPGGSTMMACHGMDLESSFIKSLDEVDRYKIKKNGLTLFKGKKEVASFVRYVPDIVDMHNAENSLDIVGIYTGVVPIMDAPAVETTLELKNDKSYLLIMKYADREDKIEERGRFTIDKNQLMLETNGKRSYFSIAENSLTWLDNKQNKRTGPLADQYTLQKK